MMDSKQAPVHIREKVLETMPQKHPFRFVDAIHTLSTEEISGEYRVTGDEFFFPGHFPGRPTMPGVILIEAMAQVSVVALGIYETMVTGGDLNKVTLFTECDIEFFNVVPPGSKILIHGKKIYFRRGKIKSKAWVTLEDGTLIARGHLAGIGANV
ncbi:3-hydroxyacyl-ACP dehydratase FabZ family protein [Fidelibacter multiformis]|jgi:3-hydroxyacyl-[acyl-carrier-protein] dehydratase|uniref:3-hydroxyacyl-ACP dehydratase FabZ family protein n=1 Tax=Fidelibacter multiformis TaxID=3377529 RepID=UPI0037DD2F40